MSQAPRMSRRAFFGRGAAAAGGLVWASSLQLFMAKRARGQTGGGSPYGAIAPVKDQTTGLELLQLPKGFSYMSYGWTGDLMSDDIITPALHDGMGVLQRGDDDDDDDDDDNNSSRIVIVRNHEVAAGEPFVNNPKITYRNDGGGGTTNLVFNVRKGRWEKAWSSLAGTIRNCAGGVTPWGTWITCEETTVEGHGYCFEVGRRKGDPTPLTDMGLFSHEAVAVDPCNGDVYETEDASDCGFYVFEPRKEGRLEKGGWLYMLRVKDEENADLGKAYEIGTTWDVDWVQINEPEGVTIDGVFYTPFMQGYAKGGARFRRLEGAWPGEDKIYFLSTDGGQVGEGQVFEYDPKKEKLKLIYDSPSQADCENPDNLVVTPRGGLLLCEDNSGRTTNDAERLLGLTFDGTIFTFAKNNVVLTKDYNADVKAGDYRQAEWAGACYSPDGKWLFANIQTPGITFAITGPWNKGTL